ncbi:hypothetical protein ACFFRR_009722 [Megaselia abdita]
MQERSKFRELRMAHTESFVDFELRCEKQINIANEELADALTRRSIPEISKTLRLLAPTFENNIFAIIRQGTHLDNLRKADDEQKSEIDASVKPVMLNRREYHKTSRDLRHTVTRNSKMKTSRGTGYRKQEIKATPSKCVVESVPNTINLGIVQQRAVSA